MDLPEMLELTAGTVAGRSATGAGGDAECVKDVRGRCREAGGAQSKCSSSTKTLEDETTMRPSTRTSYDPFELRDRPRKQPTQPRPLRLGLCW